MVTILLALNAVICILLVLLILLQRSDPASGGMFGGAGGSGQAPVRNPLAKPTAILAGLFLVFSVVTAILNKGAGHGGDTVMNTAEAPAVPTLPEAALLPDVTATTAPVSTTIITTPTTAPSPTATE